MPFERLEGSQLVYQGLSYAWGDDEPVSDIILQDLSEFPAHLELLENGSNESSPPLDFDADPRAEAVTGSRSPLPEQKGTIPENEHVAIKSVANEYRQPQEFRLVAAEGLDMYMDELYDPMSFGLSPKTPDRRSETSPQRFHVRSNLYNALRRLQSEETDLWFWIDAVCINQKDDREKKQLTCQNA